jgi:hypothetical protein
MAASITFKGNLCNSEASLQSNPDLLQRIDAPPMSIARHIVACFAERFLDRCCRSMNLPLSCGLFSPLFFWAICPVAITEEINVMN